MHTDTIANAPEQTRLPRLLAVAILVVVAGLSYGAFYTPAIYLVSPPDLAVSVRGRARVIREHMQFDEQYAILHIDVEQVKNDMVRTIVIESAITVTPYAGQAGQCKPRPPGQRRLFLVLP